MGDGAANQPPIAPGASAPGHRKEQIETYIRLMTLALSSADKSTIGEKLKKG